MRYIRETLMGLAQINIAQAKSSPSANLALIGQEANRPRGLIGRLENIGCHSRQMWQLSRESEVPGEVVETNSTLRPHEQQPGTQPPHWTRTPQFAVWMTRTPSCRRGKRGSLMWSGGSLGTLPSQRRSMQSACRQAQCRCGGQQIACPSHTKVFLISTR